MPRYSICIVTKEYRSIIVEAETEMDAKDQAWDRIEDVMNWKPEDYDTEIYVESTEEEENA